MKKVKCYQDSKGDFYIFQVSENSEINKAFIRRVSYDGQKIVDDNVKRGMTIKEFENYFTRSFTRKK